jgi:hypothetical protein
VKQARLIQEIAVSALLGSTRVAQVNQISLSGNASHSHFLLIRLSRFFYSILYFCCSGISTSGHCSTCEPGTYSKNSGLKTIVENLISKPVELLQSVNNFYSFNHIEHFFLIKPNLSYFSGASSCELCSSGMYLIGAGAENV